MLTSLPVIKSFLGIPLSNTSQDAQLSALMDAADQTVRSYTGREFDQRTYTEYYAGTDYRTIILRQTPVVSITSVYDDVYGDYGDNPGGSFGPATLLTLGSDYNVDYDGEWPKGSGTRVSYSGLLIRLNSIWQMRSRAYYPLQLSPDSQSSDGTIKVTYTAGYNPIPMDVQTAVCMIVSYLKRTIKFGGELEGEKIGDYSYYMHFPRHIMPPEIGSARQILSRYKDLVI